jgi:hypothetical protein
LSISLCFSHPRKTQLGKLQAASATQYLRLRVGCVRILILRTNCGFFRRLYRCYGLVRKTTAEKHAETRESRRAGMTQFAPTVTAATRLGRGIHKEGIPFCEAALTGERNPLRKSWVWTRHQQLGRRLKLPGNRPDGRERQPVTFL